MAFKMVKSESVEPWYKKYEPTLKDKIFKFICNGFHNFIYTLTNDLGWRLLDVIIDGLANMEVNFRLAKNKELLENLEHGDVCVGPEDESWNHLQIPEHELYCCDCPFRTISNIARFFYGEQYSGYCYYLNQGDFSFAHATELLWDGCKECAINDDIDYEDAEEISLEELKKEINYDDYTAAGE